MALGKKDCNICGEKTGFFGRVNLVDGLICERCFEKAQAVNYRRNSKGISLDEIRKDIIVFEAERKELEKMAENSTGIMRIQSKNATSLEEIMVGLPAARTYNGKVTVFGRMMSGIAADRKQAVVIHGDLRIPMRILAVARCNEKDDMNALFAKDKAHEQVEAPYGVRLILDEYNLDMVSSGDVVIIK